VTFSLRVLAMGVVCLLSVYASAKHASPEKSAKTSSSASVKKAANDRFYFKKMVGAIASKNPEAAPNPDVSEQNARTDDLTTVRQLNNAEFMKQAEQDAPNHTVIDPDTEPDEYSNEELDDYTDEEPDGEKTVRRETGGDDFLALQLQSVLPELYSEYLTDIESNAFLSADPNNLDLLWPVETRTISSAWGPRVRRTSTVVKTPNGKKRVYKTYNSVHKGVDLTAPLGHSIFAAMDGRIISVGRDRKLGNFVKIEHGNGVETVYGHNSANLVKVGDLVRRGQIIARVGNTGHSTGPHVHFEVKINGLQVNPSPWLNDTDEIPADILAHNERFQTRSRTRQ